MKNRFNALDVAAIIDDLRSFAVGRRVANVYDFNGKTYLFKLSGATKGKGVILVESGIRVHLTNHDWQRPDIPNGFAMKLRKHLRGCMLFNVTMPVTGSCLERVLDFDFGKHRLIVELYDHGNIILTTNDYMVIYALRQRIAVGEKYPTEPAAESDSDINQRILEELHKVVKEDGSCDEKEQLRKWLPRKLGRRFGGSTVLLEHSLTLNSMDAKKPLRDCIKAFASFELFLNVLMKAVVDADELLSSIMKFATCGSSIADTTLLLPLNPCITLTPIPTTNGDSAVFDEFIPFKFAHLCANKTAERLRPYESFSEAVDEFFWKQEDSKLKLKEANERDAAMKRIENVKRDHDGRIKQLQDEADNSSLAANLLEQNLAIVDKAIVTVRTAVTAGLAQADIEQLLLEARMMGDPTAAIIYKIEVDKNRVKLRFNNILVEVDFTLTGILNTEKLWSKRRIALEKLAKTTAAAQTAVKNAEKSIGAVASKKLGEVDERVRSTRAARRPFWFEQFAWFISSDGRLVIAGRDHQQNELLVRRYMASTDIFIHCELHGAGVVLIKTGLESTKLSSEDKVPPPPSTLREAAMFAVARSMAWQEGTPAHAYWVWGTQVSKTPQTGEFVTPGAFIIRGKRNILPLEPLVLGLGVIFVSAPKFSENGEDDVEGADSSDDEQLSPDNKEKKEQNRSLQSEVTAETKLEVTSEEGDEKKKSTILADDEIDAWANVGKDIEQEVVVVNTINTNVLKKQQQQQQKKKQTPQEPVHERPVTSQQSQKQKQPTRGQKGKLKKIKEKYADQDEEEREARMALLQSAGTKGGKKDNKKGNKHESVPSSAPPNRQYPDRPKRESKNSQSVLEPNIIDEADANETEGDIRNRLNKQRHQIDDALHRFICDPMKKTPLIRIYSAPSIASEMNEVDGQSLASRPILFALPTCAPYPSLSRCAFRVKLIPGKTKRGKVARAAVEAWQRQLTNERQQRSREGENASISSMAEQKLQQVTFTKALIKAIPDDEWSKNMPQSCKLMLSGAAQAAATEKAKKKNLAKKQKQAAVAAGNSTKQ